MLRPPLVRLRFRLWLPILRNSAQHLTMMHFLFSSHGSRTVRRDFNPCIDIVIIFQMSCLLSFSFMLQGTRHGPDGLEIRGIRGGRSGAVIRTLENRRCAKQSEEFVHGALPFQLHMSFAQIIPEIVTASIPPPGKVEALAKYKPLIGVLK